MFITYPTPLSQLPDIRVSLEEYVDASLSVLVDVVSLYSATPTPQYHHTWPLAVVQPVMLNMVKEREY